MSRWLLTVACGLGVAALLPAADRPPNVVLILADDLGVRRTRLLRPEAHPHAEHRQAGRGRDEVHPVLRRQRRVRPVAVRAHDRQAHGPRHRPQQHRRSQPERPVPDPGRRRDRRRAAQGEGVRDRGDGQVGPRHVGHHRQPAEARVRPLLRLQLPGPRPQPLPEVPLPQRRAVRAARATTASTGKQLHAGPVRGRRRSTFIEANKDKPFFLYLPFIVPHVAVQVPEDSLAEYKGKLGDDPPYDGKTRAGRATCRTRPRTPATPRWSRAWTAASAASWTS